MPATIYILTPATEQHSKGSSEASRVWSRACVNSHSRTPTQNLAVGWWLMGKPWNSYIRSEPQECRGSGKWRGLPKHRLQESRNFPGSHQQDAQLPASAVCRATEPHPHCSLQTCCKMPPRGWQRWSAHWAGAQKQLKVHWTSFQACRDVFWFCSLGITKMRHTEPGALRCLQRVGHTQTLSLWGFHSVIHILKKKMKIK